MSVEICFKKRGLPRIFSKSKATGKERVVWQATETHEHQNKEPSENKEELNIRILL